MRRHMYFLAVGQQKPVGLAMLVDEKLVHDAGDFGQVVGVDPMHCKLLASNCQSVLAVTSQGACQQLNI